MEKTLFTGTNFDTRRTEVYDWLTANASDIFSSIKINENKNIICTIENGGSITLDYSGSSSSGSSTAIVTLANGTVVRSYNSSSNNKIDYRHYYGIKTDKGIYLCCLKGNSSGSGNGYWADLLISKETDGVVLSFVYSNGSSSSGSKQYIICPEKDLSYNVTNSILSAEMTTFVPIPLTENSYATNLQFMPFNMYKGTIGQLTDSTGQKYVSDGYCALKY